MEALPGGKPFSSLFSTSYVFGLLSQSTWPVRILATGWVIYVLATWRERRADERLIALFPVAYLAILQSSPIKAIRYLLPVVVVAHYLAGLAVAALVLRFTRPGARRALALAAAALVVLTPQVAELRVHLDAFARDGRLLLYDFVRSRVPAGSHVLQDRYAGLPDPKWGYATDSNPTLPVTLTTRHYAPEFGDLAAARAAGIEYVAVCSRAYGRFFGEEKSFSSPEARARFEGLRAGYEALFREGELVFEAGRSEIAGAPVDPVVRLYRLQPATGPPLPRD